MRLEDLTKNLLYLNSLSKNPLEDWDRVVYSGDNNGGLLGVFSEVFSILSEIGQVDKITLYIDDGAVDSNELEAIEKSGGQFESWRLLLSKEGLTSCKDKDTGLKTIFFLDRQRFIDWAQKLNPFDGTSPFRQAKTVRVFVEGLEDAFGGPSLAVTSFEDEVPPGWPMQTSLPGEEDIKAQVHVGSSESVYFSPAPFLLSWGDLECKESKPFRMLSWKLLAACLVQDFFGTERIVLRGVRRLELPLCLEEDVAPEASSLNELIVAVKWVYEEKVETRAKLLAERLSLDLESGSSLASQLPSVLKCALTQAREQYGFVILERKDEYVRELRALLKDVKAQSDLYADKTRSLLSGLLRDALGALLLVTVSMLARAGQNANFLSSPGAGVLFKALGVYFLASIVLQGYVHISDLCLSNSEVGYWSNATRNYMPASEQERHLREGVQSRKTNFWIAATLFGVLYLFLAIVSFFFPDILAWISAMESGTT